MSDPILYRIKFCVRPTKSHPLFWEMGIGLLSIWVFEKDSELAKAHAQKIVELLPYELVHPNPKSEPSDVITEDMPILTEKANEARSLGIAIWLIAAPVGTDEEYENLW